MIEIWKCTACDWQGEETELNKECIYPETRIDPAEWESSCPDCNRAGDNLIEVEFPFCRTCEDVIVPNEGDQCTECYTCHQEALADETRGH